MATQMKDLGTVLDYTGKKGKLITTDRNEQGTKRIIVTLVNKKGEKWKVCCSDPVTKLLRDKELAVGQLMKLTLMRDADNDDAPVFICLPAGKEIVYNVEELDIRDYETKEISKEDYLVL